MHNHLAVQLYITAFNIENLHGYVPQRWEKLWHMCERAQLVFVACHIRCNWQNYAYIFKKEGDTRIFLGSGRAYSNL